MKKLLIVLGVALFALYFTLTPQHFYDQKHCPFCQQTVVEKQMFYENSSCYALYPHRPVMKGHCLVIPKRHVERFEFLTKQEWSDIQEAIGKVHNAVLQEVQTSSYLLLQKNGKEVGQSVSHLHMHYMPRKLGDSSILKLLCQMWVANLAHPISENEMDLMVNTFKESINRSESFSTLKF